jgi:hypothetical protein
MASTRVPPVPKPKKGTSPWVWVAAGCGGILVLGGIVMAVVTMFVVGKVKEAADDPVAVTAQMIAAANPDIELVSADKDSKLVTFRDVRSGEELTFSYEDIEEGRFTLTTEEGAARIDFDGEGESGKMTVTTDEGTATFGAGDVANLPDWLPVYGGDSSEGVYSSDTPDARAGGFGFETSDGLEDVLSFYTTRLESAGLQIRSRTTTPDGALLVASSSDESKTATVTISTEDGGVSGMVNFVEKK